MSVIYWTDGVNWYGVVGKEIVAEIPVTKKNKNNPPAWFKRTVKQYEKEHKLKKVM
jgi:hypothetical protein